MEEKKDTLGLNEHVQELQEKYKEVQSQDEHLVVSEEMYPNVIRWAPSAEGRPSANSLFPLHTKPHCKLAMTPIFKSSSL